jgi:AraC-like DNA-binding protein
MHPQASYYDAFWQESCSGAQLGKFFAASFEEERLWYRPLAETIPTPNGVIVRYEAFHQDDALGVAPIYNGAEVLTLADGLILTISDYYCDPTPAELVEVATLAEGQHARVSAIERGLSARTAARIRRRLAELASGSVVILDPSLTATMLADHIGCTVMHLFHVLEETQNTTFVEFVNGCRARHASTIMIDTPEGDVRFDKLARRCGFQSVEELDDAFRSTFGLPAEEYMSKFAS